MQPQPQTTGILRILRLRNNFLHLLGHKITNMNQKRLHYYSVVNIHSL